MESIFLYNNNNNQVLQKLNLHKVGFTALLGISILNLYAI